MAALEIVDLRCSPLGLSPLRGVDLRLDEGEFVEIVGPSGSGTETLCRCLAGLHRPLAGCVRVGETPSRALAWDLARIGLYVMLRGRQAFNEMTVQDNLLAAPRAWNPNRQANLNDVFRLFPVLAERRQQIAGSLSGGERQILAIGRALMACPCVLVIEDPYIGLSPRVIRDISDLLVSISSRGIAVLVAGEGCSDGPLPVDRSLAMENGRIVDGKN